MQNVLKLRYGRAADPDGLIPELLKCAIGLVNSSLQQLFLRLWPSGKLPVEWKSGIVLALTYTKATAQDINAQTTDQYCQFPKEFLTTYSTCTIKSAINIVDLTSLDSQKVDP